MDGPENLISAENLSARLAEGGVSVFDCGFDLADPEKGRRDYLAAHIHVALYVDLERDLSGPKTGLNGRHPLPDPDVFAEAMRALGLRRGRLAVAYDSSGGIFAARLWWMLRWAGHERVAVLDGGLQAWRDLGLPLETGEGACAEPGDFVGTGLAGPRTVTAAEVQAAIGSDAMRVIDARAASRFRGEPNPMDPTPGRIPGARNRPSADNLRPDGRFKAPGELGEDFARVLGGRAPTEAVLQCGSGVTACHNALAMAVAGLDGARLYPGSWSEWIADPSRPVETGPVETGPVETGPVPGDGRA
jgi:thiosulfate/3-mercaptopyruvate sulfurtransferase